jgi:hypothetical protein
VFLNIPYSEWFALQTFELALFLCFLFAALKLAFAAL